MDLASLSHRSISSMSLDEGIEHIRQIRLSRRTVAPRPARKTTKKYKKKDESTDSILGRLTPAQMESLLKSDMEDL